ncbi:peptidoglycan-binding protein [Alkalihalobacillus sp. LMS39]|uniref:peptidoglycan-binding protein n=1 Tax=Alkalihalobacillus sp. LMS39 TaxID=2924032 RepID=UPI001FB41005|nr:peptidoglycan-binding protein [Alkalihalobacillus sp. LMS39]UOE93832.1 peptidoglycan-binding protein [Alkalihalobacillus sp. LMS39]
MVILLSSHITHAQNLELSVGMTDESVIQLKIDLDQAGFKVSDNPTSYFGSVTEQKLKEFQEANGLLADGIANEETLAKLLEIIAANEVESEVEVEVETNEPTSVVAATTPVLQNGVRHRDVVDLKINLEKAGFQVPGNTTDFFGPQTEARVKEFQRAFGLTADGVAGPATLSKLNEVISSLGTVPLLRNGVRHPAVIELKINLEKVGFQVPGNTTDFFGSQTEAKVKEFQRAYGLTADGVAGPATLNKLDEAVSTLAITPLLRNGVRHPAVIELKINLEKVGFQVPGNTTDFFGSQTETQVRAFQRVYGLTVDGIAGPLTLQTLDEVVVTSANAPLLRNGVRHPSVITLKVNLSRLGFTVPGNTTDFFGAQTETMVRSFQRTHGLTADGIAGPQTLAKIQELIANPNSLSALRNGVYHPDVVTLKINLAKAGFPVPGSTTDFFGSQTEAQVRAFQRYHRLSVDGMAGPQTLSKINEVITSLNNRNFLRVGSSSEAVMILKIDLGKVGFPVPGNTTAFFGVQTETVLKNFQRSQGLPMTGVTDTDTMKRLEDRLKALNRPPTVLKLGLSHSSVVQLKRDLASAGFPVPGNGTTYFGSQTETQVKAFQRRHGLTADGVVGPLTQAKLQEVISRLPLAGRVIVVDAGHGGSDPGAVAFGIRESDIALDISRRLERKLTAAGATVVMTRTADTTVALNQRAPIANNLRADAFISVHLNAGGGTGTETFWDRTHASADSQRLATNIQTNLVSQIKLRDRGVKHANFLVLRESRVPSALVEVAFMDTRSDSDKIKTASFRESAAEGIYRGILAQFR